MAYYDQILESGVVATLIYHPEFYYHADFLKPEHFYNLECRCFYESIVELIKSGITNIDAYNLTTVLLKNKLYQELLQTQKMPDLQQYLEKAQYVVRDSLDEYLKLVKTVITLAYKRELIQKLRIIENLCDDATIDDVSKLHNKVLKHIDDLSVNYILHDDNVKTIGDMIDELFEKMIEKQKNGGVGLPSKFASLNEYFMYEPAELVVLEASRKTGKSMFCLNEAVHKAMMGIPVLYLDTEMTTEQFFIRLLAHMSRVEIKKIKNDFLGIIEYECVQQAKEAIKKLPLIHIYKPYWSTDEIYTYCKMFKQKMNIGFVVYDYIKAYNTTSTAEQYNELGNKTNFLKNNIAGDLGLPVLSAAQLNRRNEIGDSYKIEQYASTVLVLRQKTADEISMCPNGNYALRVKLNRNGEQMGEKEFLDLIFEGSYANFKEGEGIVNLDID